MLLLGRHPCDLIFGHDLGCLPLQFLDISLQNRNIDYFLHRLIVLAVEVVDARFEICDLAQVDFAILDDSYCLDLATFALALLQQLDTLDDTECL